MKLAPVRVFSRKHPLYSYGCSSIVDPALRHAKFPVGNEIE